MPSVAMQDVMAVLRDRQRTSASQAPATVKEARATFAPAGTVHPVPDDVLVSEVSAGGVPAHWLTAPGADEDRVLLFLHGGGYQLGSLRSDGELAARLGRASGMRVLFPEYRLAPEHPFPAAIDDVRAVWRWLRKDQQMKAGSMATRSPHCFAPSVGLRLPGWGRPQDAPGVAAVRVTLRSPATARA